MKWSIPVETSQYRFWSRFFFTLPILFRITLSIKSRHSRHLHAYFKYNLKEDVFCCSCQGRSKRRSSCRCRSSLKRRSHWGRKWQGRKASDANRCCRRWWSATWHHVAVAAHVTHVAHVTHATHVTDVTDVTTGVSHDHGGVSDGGLVGALLHVALEDVSSLELPAAKGARVAGRNATLVSLVADKGCLKMKGAMIKHILSGHGKLLLCLKW